MFKYTIQTERANYGLQSKEKQSKSGGTPCYAQEKIMAKWKAHHPRSIKATARRILKKRK